MPVIVEHVTQASLLAALIEADSGSREVLIRGGEHVLDAGVSYIPQNSLHVYSDGGGARLVAPSNNGSPYVLHLGSLAPIGVGTLIGMAIEKSYYFYAPGHTLVAGDYVLIADAGSAHSQVTQLLDVRGPYLYPAESLVHTWSSTWAPGSAWVYKLALMPSLDLEGLDFDNGANGGSDTRGLLVGGCLNGNFHNLHSRGFGSGQGFIGSEGGIGFAYQYGSTFDRISSDRDGSDGNWGFGINDSANIDVRRIRSGLAQGFGVEYVRVHHSQFGSHKVSASNARGVKFYGCAYNQLTDIRIERAGALNTSWYTGFSITGGSHDNWGTGISVQGSIAEGIWFSGEGNHYNHFVNCRAVGNGIGSGSDLSIPVGDNYNYVSGSFQTVYDGGLNTIINTYPL